ncbi:bifunctional oligoribonuclease/PAP phosphatase NrnA [Candidatus Sumerlaeota bacterium]|nr:bifunctional oligoribonuclease/PAP phosphatase NrnA [Candidatus Sumerlaeota bacterium]
MPEQPSRPAANEPGKTDASSNDRAIAEIATILRENRRFVVCTHVRPDGDAVGSTAAMYHYLKAKGKEVQVYFRGPVQENLHRFLTNGTNRHDEPYPADFPAEVTLCLDSAAPDRIVENFLELARGRIVNIDHHYANPGFGSVNWVDSDYASVGEMIASLFETDPDPAIWTRPIASALFLAVATDTGSFRFPNTTAKSFHIAARLVERGADPAEVASSVWAERKMETMRIASTALSRMRFELDGRLVWSEITQDLFRANGGEENEPDNLTSELRSIRGTEVALLLRETHEGTARGSLRSSDKVDVSIIAEELGGGGHPRAAGFEIQTPYGQVRDKILNTVCEGVRRQIGPPSAC